MNADPDLVRLLKRLKLGQLVPTLAERLTLARAQQLDYVAFLTLLLADEVQRRDQQALERHLVQAASRTASRWIDSTGPRRSNSTAANSTGLHPGVPGAQGACGVRGSRRRRQEHAGPMLGSTSVRPVIRCSSSAPTRCWLSWAARADRSYEGLFAAIWPRPGYFGRLRTASSHGPAEQRPVQLIVERHRRAVLHHVQSECGRVVGLVRRSNSGQQRFGPAGQRRSPDRHRGAQLPRQARS